MAILAAPRRALARLISPDKGVINAIAQAFMVGGPFTAYDTKQPTYLEQGYLYNPVVYSVVNQRANKAKSIPYHVKRVKDDQAKKKLDFLRSATKNNYTPQQYVKKRLLETKAFDETILDFPLPKPNPNQSWGEIIALYETFMACTGNFYLYMRRGEFLTEPLQVYVLPSHLMQIVIKDKASFLNDENPISYYRLVEGNLALSFEQEEVIHIKLPNPEYGQNGEHLYGLSPIRAALRNLQSSNLAIDGNVRAMLNSGAFGFIHGKGPTPLTETQAASMKERLQEMDSSNDRLSKIQGATAELGFTQIALTTDELKPFDFLNYDQKQICNVLGWDTKLLNDNEGAKYDNYELAIKGVVTRTTMPSLKLLEEALTQLYLPLFKGYDNAVFEFDYSELPEMQIDVSEMVGWLKDSLDRGVINRDEFRGAINYPMLGTAEMEAFTVLTDVIPLTEALEEDFTIDDTQGI